MERGFAFLVLDDHPYGREMLAQLLDAGLEPTLVIEEVSELATLEREKFLERMRGFEIAPPLSELLAGRDVRRESVRHHNAEECAELVLEARPDLIVLGGTRILKPFVFGPASDGCLNAHPGLLPEVRGSASVAWAVRRDVPIGCTCHFIDPRIDEGPIVSRRVVPVHRGDTYERLCYLTARMSGTLMTEAVAAWRAGTLSARPQAGSGETHRNMPDELVAEVKEKLSRCAYAHYVD